MYFETKQVKVELCMPYIYSVLIIEKTQGQGGEIFSKMFCVFIE